MKKYHAECFVCNSPKIAAVKGYERHDLAKCRACGFVFMRAIPTLDELNKYYSSYSYGSAQFLSPITIKSYNLLLDEFEKYRKSNRILDVGCGVGFFLEQAKKRGWEVYGTEYSQKAIEICKEKGIQIVDGILDSMKFDYHDFDVVTSFEVIEHINNPVDELRQIRSLLRKGGLFYCTTPNFNSLLRYYLKENYNVIGYPEHLSYYTRRTLSALLRNSGFKKKKFLSTGVSLSIIKNSKPNEVREKRISENSSDEKLRREIETKWYLGVAKKMANNLLTLTSTGLTLKAYFERE
jgi:2-polyprenyl-3-methyl-5-hydroxy-6-metoxy-1,4-benzoquinol methylase